MRDFRALTPVEDPPTRNARADDPALGFDVLLQGFGRTAWARIRRGLDTATDRHVLQPLSRPYPLLGFRRPSCANAPAICAGSFTCTELFAQAPASPSLQRLANLTPRQAYRTRAPVNRLPV